MENEASKRPEKQPQSEREGKVLDSLDSILAAMDKELGDDDNLDLSASKPAGHVRRHSEGIYLADSPTDPDANAGKEDDGAHSDTYSVVDSEMIREMIREATEAAVEDAIAMKRSDSFMSTESNEPSNHSLTGEGDDSRSIDAEFPAPPTRDNTRSASVAYMEEASFETTIASPGGRDKVIHHGRISKEKLDFGRRSSSMTDGGGGDSIRSVDNLLGDSQTRRSERYDFTTPSTENYDDSARFLETIVSDDHDDNFFNEDTESTHGGSLQEVLKACNIEFLHVSNPATISFEVNSLHQIFRNFCRPPISVEMVKAIYQKEQQGSYEAVELPKDVVINRPMPSVSKLLGTPLMSLPQDWAMSFFRILLRILTNESDAEYDFAVLKTCPWYEESFGEGEATTALDDPPANKQRSFSEHSMGGMVHDMIKSNRFYSIVRLRGAWTDALDNLILALDQLLHLSEYDYLQGPATRFLGILCSSGISTRQLKHVLDVATSEKANAWTQLLLVRALREAASGSLKVPPGAPSPFSLFSFTSGPGLKRTISIEKTAWPFKNDFGMAVWFRAEDFDGSSILFQAISESGDGIKVSLEQLEESSLDLASAATLQVAILEGGRTVQSINVRQCVLHPRVWYHVGVRHTRSRLKGVFSMGSREQLVIFLDGKMMVTDSVRFPHVQDPKSLFVAFGEKYDGQTGSLYIFNKNVSDATMKALYEKTLNTVKSPLVKRSSQVDIEWTSHQQEIATKSKVLSLEMREDDLEDIVLSYHSAQTGSRDQTNVIDIDTDESDLENGSLSLAAFATRLYVVWNPTRTCGQVALDLHSGAHVRMDSDCTQGLSIDTLQDVLGSLGGIYRILQVFRSLLSMEAEGVNLTFWSDKRDEIRRSCLLCSIFPDVLLLLASLVRDHNENAREVLRCGGVDMLEQTFWQCKDHAGSNRSGSMLGELSLFSALSIFPSLSSATIDALMELQASSSHYIGLEARVFSKFLFNPSLWLGNCASLPIYSDLLPYLSWTADHLPGKVADCVGVTGTIQIIVDLVEGPEELIASPVTSKNAPFARNSQRIGSLCTPLSEDERWHICEVLFAILARVLFIRSTFHEVSFLVGSLSKFLESEWEQASEEVKEGIDVASARSGRRELRYRFSLRVSALLLFSLESPESPDDFLPNYVMSCGGLQACAAWILSTMVNSYCDKIRAIGIRCFVAYIHATGQNPDAPFTFTDHIVAGAEKGKPSDGRSLQENTLTLISTVGHGLLKSNVGKGLASIGPVIRPKLQDPARLTPRVAFKLLWHLLKSHRFRIEKWSRASLVWMVFEQRSHKAAIDTMIEKIFKPDTIFYNTTTLDWSMVSTILGNETVSLDAHVRGELGMNTIIRLLRFLPEACLDNWLTDLGRQVSRRKDVADMFSSTPDWQPSLFQLLSEILERLFVAARKSPEQFLTTSNTCQNGRALIEQLNLALDLYSMLLANLIRNGGEGAMVAIEECSSLQRICVNGKQVLALILSKLFSNLGESGVLPLEKVAVHAADENQDQTKVLLKRSARFVTDTILSNSSKTMTMPEAVDCWRSLRHLTATAVALLSCLGFGASAFLAPDTNTASAVDPISKGLFGIRILNDDLDALGAEDVLDSVLKGDPAQLEQDIEEGSSISTNRRICVKLCAQVLALIDVFIFPVSLDANLPISQLHGLSLVRNTESRVGGGQGPLLASLVRLSLVLLNQLEPCSVSLLQCSSRLRCFLHWIFEMIRESEALDGYSATFNRLTAPFDRLILLIVIQCRQVLKRARCLRVELEAPSSAINFGDGEVRKKMYRRLLRVALETREILATVFEQRVDLLRSCFTESSFEALQVALDKLDNGETSKEAMIQKLLESKWVHGFEEMTLEGSLSVPTFLRDTEGGRAMLEITEMQRETKDMIASFERSLNVSFERYLESQRKWAETGAVRDLEFEGDNALTKLSTRYDALLQNHKLHTAHSRKLAKDRWSGIEEKVYKIWSSNDHWRLPASTGISGKRIVLEPNCNFDDHGEASYELLMGREREREDRERQERLKRKEELAELMKRNSDAFVPIVESVTLEEDDEKDAEAKEELDDEELTDRQDDHVALSASDVEHDNEENAETPGRKSLTEEKQENDTDGWARSFVWSHNESIVARFDSVVIVTLEYLVRGQLLLTTHGLYFHPTGEAISTVTKEKFNHSETQSSTDGDRRWRLSRLTEVHGRRYILRPQALELFFSDCHDLFINFIAGSKDRKRFYAKLRNSCRVPMLFSSKSLNPRTIFKRSNITELWRKRRISNFDYIMALNRMAGRTFNDIAQYPVFPWILADYTSEKIDLADSRIYRDLSKPVGALNPDRLSQLLERYKELEQFGFAENERFLYGSHYSSPGVVLHFLIRQEPFTSMAIDLQSGRFDCPDRLFFDLTESWRGCNTSSSDVKELIPEFFTLPEMFLNTNRFPLGKTQRGHKIDNVRLPPWAKGSAYEFVRIHRLALESDHVSKNLHHWIDLIFGFKQRGPGAEAAHNIFHHLSYEGAVDLDKIMDEVDRQAAESHIQNFGQTPGQLLAKDSHPSRLREEECWYPLINNMSSTVRLRCHTPGKQYGGKNANCGSALSIGIQSDLVTVIYSDLKVGTYKWYPKAAKNRLKPDKLRPLPNRLCNYSRGVTKRGSATPRSKDEAFSQLSVGNWSFLVTQGGYEKEQRRRQELAPSRLASAKDALYTDSASLIVSCGYWDNTIKIHSTDAWKLECTENGGHRGRINCLALAEDGALMVSGGQDCTCRIWVVDYPDLAIALADGYTQTSLGHSTDGENILSCCHILWGHERPISCIKVSSNLDAVVSGSLDGKICVHSLRRGKFIRAIRPPSRSSKHVPVKKLALDKHGRFVVFTGDGSLHTFSINGVCLCTVDAGEEIHDMVITGEVLITGGDQCHVYIRDLTTLKILSGLDLSRHGPIRSVSLTPDDLNPTPQHLFIGSDDGMISIVDREDIRIATTGR